MARKRTHGDAPRTRVVSVRLRDETFTDLTQKATALGLSRAGYVEHLIENRAIRTEAPSDDALPIPLINELKRIGNNLNQLAHSVNAGWPHDAKAMAQVMQEIVAVMVRNEQLKRRFGQAQAIATRERQEAQALHDQTEAHFVENAGIAPSAGGVAQLELRQAEAKLAAAREPLPATRQPSGMPPRPSRVRSTAETVNPTPKPTGKKAYDPAPSSTWAKLSRRLFLRSS